MYTKLQNFISNLQWIIVIICTVSTKQSDKSHQKFKNHDKFCYKTELGYEADKVCYQTDFPYENDESIQFKNYTNSTQNTKRRKRYILYEINPGEGFNLRRDIFVRIAPLIKDLNVNSDNFEWILVLPPWNKLPHWKNHQTNNKGFPWSTFFSLESIQNYIPVLELDQFLHDYGQNKISLLLNLAHFPFTRENTGNGFKDRVAFDHDCKPVPFNFKREKNGETVFKGEIWTRSFILGKIDCVSVRGTESTLIPLLIKEASSSTTIFLNNAEVILWDEYGGEEYWRARACLKFSPHLINIAKKFQTLHNLPSNPPYLGVHLRRRDFLLRNQNSPAPSIQTIAIQIKETCLKLGLSTVFIATDGDENERAELKSILKSAGHIFVWTSPCVAENELSDGQCAIIDQLLSSWSSHFVGTEGSTFTLRIFEERLLLGKDMDSTYNYICSGGSLNCPKPTRWGIPESVKNLIYGKNLSRSMYNS